MNKIIKACLEAKFQNINIESLMLVINATPNEQVAAELLMGIYEKPQLPVVVKSNDYKDHSCYKMTDYDIFTDKVKYTFSRPEYVEKYLSREISQEKVDAMSMEDFKALPSAGTADGKWIRKATGNLKQDSDTMSSERWLKCERVDVE